jgi:hypothetical protein
MSKALYFVSRRDAEVRRDAEMQRKKLCVSASSAPLRETHSALWAGAML